MFYREKKRGENSDDQQKIEVETPEKVEDDGFEDIPLNELPEEEASSEEEEVYNEKKFLQGDLSALNADKKYLN